jgi:ABC-2 type transport system ATP-binding protein
MENILEIKDLRKEYEEFTLENISLNIPKGFITGIIGPNGAGKTTTIKLIMNLIKADSGEIKVFGLSPQQHEKEIKNRIGYVGEEQYFYEHHSAAWTGKFVSHFFDQWDMETFNRLLDDFEIPRKKWIRKYSKGMKVKLSLAIALSHNAELIILDEPTAGLDPVVRRDVLNFLQKCSLEENHTVLISSHITDDIARIADFITYMIKGRIALFKAKDDLLANWKKVHFKKDSLDKKIIDSMENVQEHMFGNSAITRNFLEIQGSLTQGITAGDIRVENIDLDDILISLAGRQ